jgi:phi LC3 family holin|nr:MAG TPA: holin [Caudoviricetes sp.]
MMSVKVGDIPVSKYYPKNAIVRKVCYSPIEMEKIMKKLNWKVRFNRENILFISQVIISVVVPILTYFGLQASDLTTWTKVGDTFVQAVSNPYVVVMALVSLFNAITDPTTKGIGDSEKALTYTSPKK